MKLFNLKSKLSNHKDLIVGVVIGAILFGNVGIIASNIYNITPNPFKITVNGLSKNIEGYNINGSTYFKLRDIGNEVGFNVDFKENTIMIENTDETGNTKKLIDNEVGFYDKLLEYWTKIEHENKEYIFIAEYNNEKYIELSALASNWFDTLKIELGKDICYLINRQTKEIVSENIDTIWLENNNCYIKYSDFLTHFKPHMDKDLDESGVVKGSLPTLEELEVHGVLDKLELGN